MRDVLAVLDDDHFQQILSELSDMLRSMRARTGLDGTPGLAGLSRGDRARSRH
jgi:hypothetical protein